MSYSPNNLDDLQKLLACKRYEQPPPGYFISFSDKVIAQIEAAESCEPGSWWAQFLSGFDAKPVLVCAYGLAVSSLLFMGFRLSQAFDAEIAAVPNVGAPWLAITPGSPITVQRNLGDGGYLEAASASSLSRSKWAFLEEPRHLLFARPGPQLQPAGFTIGQ
jgi:hypothetical protein